MAEKNLALLTNVAPQVVQRSGERSHLVIRPVASWRDRIDPRAVWRYRELIYYFTLRDLKLRYKQTALGAFWTVLQPIMTCGVFSILFGKVAKIGSDGIPYPVFCFAALIPWNYFSNSLGRGAGSLVANSTLLNKIYFPRVLIPITSLVPGLVDFFIGLAMLLPIAMWYGFMPSIVTMVAIPLLLLLMFISVLGVSLCLSALNVRFRDVSNVLPFITQIWMFLTPVIYPSSLVERYRWILSLNPMVGIISGFRSAVFGTPFDFGLLGTAIVVSFLSLGVGLVVFGGMERTFADKV